jgi:enoyl-CoA hydratase
MTQTSSSPGRRVGLHRDGAVTIVTMQDPTRRNVLTPGMVEGLVAAFDDLESDGETCCVVLVAEGPAFCAGAELGVLEASASGDFSGIEDVYRGFLRVLESPLPTIAVVNGPAVGAGLNLALACDLRLAGPDALFDSRFMRLRLIPGGGHSWLLERSVGREVAAAMVLFGARLSAEEAERAGLVWKTYESAEAATADAVKLASGLAAAGPGFARTLTQIARTAPTLPTHASALELERYTQRWSTTQPEFLAGVRRMREAVESASTHWPPAAPTSATYERERHATP